MRLASPLASAYFEHEERKHQRDLAYDTELLKQQVQWRRTLLAVGSFLGLALVVLAALLFYRGKDEAALDLIQLVVAVAGAAFGGYGVARTRRPEAGSRS